ncbi:MAG: hypothetical protein ACKVS6_10255, partial [Planctomycetota bacterium]
SLGMCGAQEMTVGAGCVLDGYNSGLGTFESQAVTQGGVLTTGNGASVNSNFNIKVLGTVSTPNVPLAPATWVYGDAHPGKDQTVITMPNATVTGSTSPNLKALTLPQIVVPAITSLGSLTLTTGSLITMADREFRYDSLRIERGGVLTVKGPVILSIGSLVMDNSSMIKFDTTAGPITLYVMDYLSCASGSTIASVPRDPKNVAILVSASLTVDRNGDGIADPPVHIASSGELSAMLYAPNANVNIPQTLRVFGSITAKKLTYATGARGTYDKALVASANTMKSLPTVVSWQIVELPDTPLVKSNADALTVLAKEGVVPIKSAVAHMEDKINIVYTDSAGNVQHYNGLSSAFDFTAVRSVINKSWTKN